MDAAELIAIDVRMHAKVSCQPADEVWRRHEDATSTCLKAAERPTMAETVSSVFPSVVARVLGGGAGFRDTKGA